MPEFAADPVCLGKDAGDGPADLGLEDDWLQRIVYTAGREQEDLTELVIEAAVLMGREKLLEKDFRLADAVMAHPRRNTGFSTVCWSPEAASI